MIYRFIHISTEGEGTIQATLLLRLCDLVAPSVLILHTEKTYSSGYTLKIKPFLFCCQLLFNQRSYVYFSLSCPSLFMCLFLYLSICLSVYIYYICFFFCLYIFICLSVYMSVCLSVYLSICLPVYLLIYIHI